jgi:AcrR family transcriptional regulator
LTIHISFLLGDFRRLSHRSRCPDFYTDRIEWARQLDSPRSERIQVRYRYTVSPLGNEAPVLDGEIPKDRELAASSITCDGNAGGRSMQRAAIRRDLGRSDQPQAGSETGNGLKRRGRQRSEESEEAILSAVIHLLREKALHDISIEEIARKAGVGKATIYKWWPSKAYLAFDAFSKRMKEMVPIRDTGNAERDFREQLYALVAFFDSPAGKLLGQFLGEGQIDEEFSCLFRERFIKPRRQLIGVIFDRAVKRGQIRSGLDRELVLDMIYGPVFYRMMIRREPLGHARVDAMVSALFQGLRGTSPRADRSV